MSHWIERLVELAQHLGASYADVRFVDRSSEFVQLWDGKIEELLNHQSLGLGVRVIVNGAWGFSGCSDLQQGEKAVAEAVQIAQQSARVQRKKVVLKPIEVIRDRWETPANKALKDVSVQERVALLMAADQEMARVKGVTQRKASMGFYLTDQIF
ncbi:MAG: hypothetical protein JEZ06_06785, partial [Anaerolineaceae bacterium]|nr:hypothetical protein [Anaerolineaceae bacterium]